jgi:hypothetical protein
MRKQQLKPDEEKFELEKKERMQKLENEKQEKKLMFDLLHLAKLKLLPVRGPTLSILSHFIHGNTKQGDKQTIKT